ncbi:MAG: glycosyltransferase [bacterium]
MKREKENIFASAVVPVHNEEMWIAEAVESALAQARDDLEIVVVDDGSTDRTPEILSAYSFPVRVITQEKQGVSVARNRAIEEARGKWIAFLDADDRWLPGHINAIEQAARQEPEAGLVCTDALVIDSEGNRIKKKPAPSSGRDTFFSLLIANHVITSAAAVRREVLEETGTFMPGLKRAQDWDLWLRVAARFPVVHSPRITVEYRRQQKPSVQNQGTSIRDDNLYVISRALKLRDVPDTVRRKALANCYLESAVRLLAGLDTRGARKELLSALRHHFFLPSAWALFPASLAGPGLVKKALTWKRQRERKA